LYRSLPTPVSKRRFPSYPILCHLSSLIV
jgi:hypothetical protein